LKEHVDAKYTVDHFPIAAAVSNLVYGAPIGTIYSGVLKPFVTGAGPTRQALGETARGKTETGPLLNVNPQGFGIGYTVVTTLAMLIFGLRLSSMTYILIGLMGISTFVFLLRYRDDRLFSVPLYFFSLTFMLFTPLVTNPTIAERIPIGGIRYFTLLAILPAMHIFWEFVDLPKSKPATTTVNLALLGVQLLLVTVVIIVRGSAGYLLGALTVAYVLALRACRGNPAGLRDLLCKGAFMAVLGAVFVGSFYLWVPEAYRESGRTMGVFWHRVLVGLGANPAWPFGNLRDTYSSCAPYMPQRYNTPQSLVPGILDWNGRCIWWAYALDHGLKPGEALEEIFGGRYESVMKQAFFEIAREYPREVWETFIYYKPILILTSIRKLLVFRLPAETFGIKSLLVVLLLAQAGTLAAFVGACRPGLSEDGTRRLTGALLLFSAWSLSPLLVARSVPFTTADLLFYIFAGPGLALGFCIKRIRCVSRRSDPGNPRQGSHRS
jgi:hypothetical protein